MFPYEKWDVFKAMLRVREIARILSAYSTKETASDLDHLRRAASSSILNLAEGCKERHLGKRIDRYCTSQGSASEANGCFLILSLSLPPETEPLTREGRELTDRICAMMTNPIRSNEQLKDRLEKEEQKRKEEDRKRKEEERKRKK